MKKEYKYLTDETAFSIATAIVSQAVKDAQADLRMIYKRPDDRRAWIHLKKDIIPFFQDSTLCPVSSKRMMQLTIEQEMHNMNLEEMPADWKTVLRLAA